MAFCLLHCSIFARLSGFEVSDSSEFSSFFHLVRLTSNSSCCDCFYFDSISFHFLAISVVSLFWFSCRLHLLTCGTPQYCFHFRCLRLSGAVAVCIILFVRSSIQFHFIRLHRRCDSVFVQCCRCQWLASSFVEPLNTFYLSVDVTLEQILCMPNSSCVRPMRCIAMPTTPCSWSTSLGAEFHNFHSGFQFFTFFRCFFSSFLSESFFKFFSAHASVLHFFILSVFSFHFLVFEFSGIATFRLSCSSKFSSSAHFQTFVSVFSCSPGGGCLLVEGQYGPESRVLLPPRPPGKVFLLGVYK